jgi:hypothetical protein
MESDGSGEDILLAVGEHKDEENNGEEGEG